MTTVISDQSGRLSDEDATAAGSELLTMDGTVVGHVAELEGDGTGTALPPLEDDQAAREQLGLEDDEDEDADTFDPLDALTIAELDAGSRLLKASVVAAVAEKSADYEKALAVVAYLHARRTDRTTPPPQLLAHYTAMRYSELSEALAAFAPKADPTTPRRA